jgi:HNH endonuclease
LRFFFLRFIVLNPVEGDFQMNALTPKQKAIHHLAIDAGMKYQVVEAEVIECLQQVDRLRVDKALGKSSLLQYAIKYMKLSEPVALQFIAVARKSVKVPALKAAISEGRISTSTANRMVSTVTTENASELISFAEAHTWRETEREIANRNPRAAVPDKVKFLGNGLVQITMTITEEEYKASERVRSVEAQKKQKSPTLGEAYNAANQCYLDKHDPVRKAERAQTKNSVRTEQKPKKPNDFNVRILISAAEKHTVSLKDKGGCTHVEKNGVRCNRDRWTHIHHIIPVSEGGTNDPANLTTLCSFHHKLVHGTI